MRILIADDDDVSRMELGVLLTRHGHEVVAVADGSEAWDILQGDNPPRLVILDWLMDRMDGVDVCRRVRECPGLRDVFMILLTSRDDQEHVRAGLVAGANDYVTKPFDTVELLARVSGGVQMVALQTELAARVRELDLLATVDGLTGIANRRGFQSRLEAECQRSRLHQTPLSLVLLDLDHFKSLNDAYGHQAGDETLMQMGRLLTASSRPTDIVARYGGEEFAMILTRTDDAAAMDVAERLRERIQTAPWRHRAVTASVGVATFGDGADNAFDLIGQADTALYHSKHHGRNLVTHCLDMNIIHSGVAVASL